MTEEEYKFLEVIYNRGSIPEQSYINYINGSQRGGEMLTEEASIEEIFSRFQNSGFIDTGHSGIYRITPLGKEKFEELSEGKEIIRSLENLSLKKTKSFHLGRRIWLALVILVIIVSIIASSIINRWEYLTELLRSFWH